MRSSRGPEPLRHDANAPGLVISPHLDDAVVSAWWAISGPDEVVVATVCAGVPPEGTTGAFDPIFGATDSAALVRARRAEDRAALALAGRTPIHLDHLDVQYRTDDLEPATVRRSLEALADRASWILAPAGLGRHPDHLLVRDATLALARDAGIPAQVYADLPYAANLGWPSWVTGQPEDPHLVPDAAWRSTLAEIGEQGSLTPTVHRLDAGGGGGTDGRVDAKLRALRCYQSQFAALEGGPHRRLTNPWVLPFEVSWSVG